MSDPTPLVYRVNSNRDTSLSVRGDMLADILDMLNKISTANGYITNPKKNILFRVDELNDSEIPANIIYDHESEEDCNETQWKHTLTVTIAHITKDGASTSSTLDKGIVDVLAMFGLNHQRFCEKYAIDPVKLKSTNKGVESTDKQRGEFDAVLEIKYRTGVWKL